MVEDAVLVVSGVVPVEGLLELVSLFGRNVVVVGRDHQVEAAYTELVQVRGRRQSCFQLWGGTGQSVKPGFGILEGRGVIHCEDAARHGREFRLGCRIRVDTVDRPLHNDCLFGRVRRETLQFIVHDPCREGGQGSR